MAESCLPTSTHIVTFIQIRQESPGNLWNVTEHSTIDQKLLALSIVGFCVSLSFYSIGKKCLLGGLETPICILSYLNLVRVFTTLT